MNKEDIQNDIAEVLCGKDKTLSCQECYDFKKSFICKNSSKCRISEKTKEQLQYVISSINKNIFLEACPGSGKTEVVGMKSAYEINKWARDARCGIAVLTFTNEATNVIRERINEFCNKKRIYPHFVGTVSSFIHEFIAQPFGYKLKKYESKTGDYSFRVIDKDVNPKLNPWITNFECKIGYARENGSDLKIYSHQITLDYQKKDCLIPISQYKDIYFKEHYNSTAFQDKVKRIREKNNKSWMYQYEYCFKLLMQDKQKFNRAGFANFEDMNNIAYRVLKKIEKVGKILSKKFPLIIVDECQDLSWIEIQILNLLKEYGSKLHFIGDLNQSVYEFKRVDPKDTLEFVGEFDKMKLTDNFRSCQEIVDLSNRLMCSEQKTMGQEKTLFKNKELLYLEYDNPKEAIEKYKLILDKFLIDYSKSCIIVKQNTLKNELLNISSNHKHLLLAAIQLWQRGNAYQKQKALEYAGKQIAKWFGGAGNKSSYYCSKDINSVFWWRVFLKNILNDCIKKNNLLNYNRNYAKWYADVRKELPNIIKNRYLELEFFDNEKRNFDEIFGGTWYRASEASKNIMDIEINDENSEIQVLTVHGSKGCTYDSTLVLSSKTNKSHSGHWKFHWIEGNEEDKRVGYVASTRAKYNLVWGVPKLTKKEKELIESFGFVDGNKIM